MVIASQPGHRLGALTPDQNAALATTPADELLMLPMLEAEQMTDSLHAYQLAKRGDSLRVMAEAVRWGKRGARINTISPGIIFTPLARDELTGPRDAGYRRMIELCPAGRGGTVDEVGTVGALLMGSRRRVHHDRGGFLCYHEVNQPRSWSADHRQRLPHQRRRYRVLLLWRTHPTVTDPRVRHLRVRLVPDEAVAAAATE